MVDKEAEEEQYRDLTLLMELLTNLLSKDFIDLSPADSGETAEEVGNFGGTTYQPHLDSISQVVTAADVCLLGLNIIMPLMSAELLKFPNLCLQVSKKFRHQINSNCCSQYFKTIAFVCEIYPEKITSLDPGLQVMHS